MRRRAKNHEKGHGRETEGRAEERHAGKPVRTRGWFYGIHWKLFGCLMSVALGLLVLVAVSVNAVMRHYLRESALEKYTYAGRILEQYMEESFSKLEDQTESFMFDDLIQRSLEEEPLTLLEQNKMSNAWNRIESKYVQNGVYINHRGEVFGKGNKPFVFPWEAYEDSGLPEAKDSSYGKLQWVWMKDTIFGTGKYSIFLIRNVRNVEHPEKAGLLLLQLGDYFMDYPMTRAEAPRELSYYLFSSQGELCYTRGNEELSAGEMAEKVKEIKTRQTFTQDQGIRIAELDQGMLFSSYEPQSGLTIVTEVPDRVIYEVSRTVGTILLLLAVVMVLIAAAVSAAIACRFTKPIHTVSRTMEAFDGSSFSRKISLRTDTELDVIGESYNRMLERMELLVREIREKEKEVRELELESMYYQLNPHFLYNTLDNIYMMARISKQKDIMNLIHALSTLLKISLNKGSGTVTAGQELEHAASYLEIQKIRFGDVFRYQIQCEEEIRERRIIKLILQPVVENSIKYGFAGMTEGGLLLIQGKQEGERLCFSVYNNGRSVSPEKLESLNRMKEMSQEEMKQNFFTEKGGFGIYNIVTRLKMTYGDAFDIQYSVPEGGGTLCCIWIP